MSYKVKQVSKLVGVSVRTLHHYDDIGLLTPEFVLLPDIGYILMKTWRSICTG